MTCRPLKSVYLGNEESPAHLLKLFHEEIETLRDISKSVDFDNREDCDQMIRNIQYLKSYLEKYHILLEKNGG